jgi:hypothetical protein
MKLKEKRGLGISQNQIKEKVEIFVTWCRVSVELLLDTILFAQKLITHNSKLITKKRFNN